MITKCIKQIFLAAAAAALWAAFLMPASGQQQIACVPGLQEMNDASREYGEELIWAGRSNAGQKFYFFASFGRGTYTVWFELPGGAICTAPGYAGEIVGTGA